jgi:GntR family transcriptional repressor for pyruvate dehydrogenase complex
MTQSRDRRGLLSERIAEELQREILHDGLVPNMRLPTELDLTERYGVSRTVVREAAKILVQRGLVTVAPGRGMVVAEFDGAHIAEQFSVLMRASAGTFEHLLDLRLAVEVQVATSAARNADEVALKRLEASLAAAEDVLAAEGPIDSDAYLDADMNFHEALAVASGNPFFDLVCRPINTFLRSHYLQRESYPSDPVRTLEEHREILDALRRGDTFGARQATEEHLRRLLRKWRTPQPSAPPSVRVLNRQNTRLAAKSAAVDPTTSQEG